MKLLFLLLLLTVMQFPATAQKDSVYHYADMSDLLMKKSKRQKTGAFILLGSGTALLTIGVLMTIEETLDGLVGSNNGSRKTDTGEVLAITGGAAMLSSVPLFIAAGKNKRRALFLSFKSEKLLRLNGSSLTMSMIPAMSLRLAL